VVNTQGQVVQVSPVVGLQVTGPIMQVTISLMQPMAQSLLQQGIALPNPISGHALIDTGASDLCASRKLDDQSLIIALVRPAEKESDLIVVKRILEHETLRAIGSSL